MHESISAWRGKDGNYCSNGIPCVTKIERKSEGVGAELKEVIQPAFHWFSQNCYYQVPNELF